MPGIKVYMLNQPPINIGGQQSRSLYQFTLQDTDTSELYHWAPIMEAKMRALPGLEDVNSDLQLKNPQVTVEMDRDKISALGLNVTQVETALYNAYGTRQVSQIYAPNNQYQVILQVAPEYQKDPSALSMLYVRSSNVAPGASMGPLIPLDTVAKVQTDTGPLSVSHTGQLPSVTISFNLKPNYALGDAVANVQATAAATLPQSVATSFQGAAQAFQDSLQGLGLILLMAIVVIYIVLGILYESFTHPLTILSGLPSAGFGALITLLIFKTELSLYAFVGIIMLVGLVKKNGIMMVDFAVEAQREHGKTPLEAIHEACLGALPADHDDDDGRARRHAADRARLGRGRRVAPSARPGGGRRSARLADAHALHHAGVLRVHRRRAPVAREPRPRGRGSASTRRARAGRSRRRFQSARTAALRTVTAVGRLSASGRPPGPLLPVLPSRPDQPSTT